jgi:hypothetical protein
MKGEKEFLPVHEGLVIEGGGIYKNHEFLIVFTDSGHRCGYVAINQEQKTILDKQNEDNSSYFLPDIDCHGGITFYEEGHAAKDLLPVPCNDTWLGFDAAHGHDMSCPYTAEKYFGETEFVKFKKENQWHYEGAVHRSYEYMEQECKKIIDQLNSLR